MALDTDARASLRALCRFIAADGPDAVRLFGRPDGMDYTLDCTDPASALPEHRAGLGLWRGMGGTERREFLMEYDV